MLLEVAHERFAEARETVGRFAELEKSPEHIHTYRISDVSLWNAAASGMDAAQIVDALTDLSRYDVPSSVLADVRDLCARYGRLRLCDGDGGLLHLATDEPALLAEVLRAPAVAALIRGRPAAGWATLDPTARGPLKQELIALGWPVVSPPTRPALRWRSHCARTLRFAATSATPRLPSTSRVPV